MTKLPELKDHVWMDEDTKPLDPAGETPRQSDIIDWLANLVSAPPLGYAQSTTNKRREPPNIPSGREGVLLLIRNIQSLHANCRRRL